MMKPDPKMFDDLARAAGGAMSLLHSMREEIRHSVRNQVEGFMEKMDFVSRREFEDLKATVQKMRAAQTGGKPAAPKAAKKPAAKKTAKSKPKAKKR